MFLHFPGAVRDASTPDLTQGRRHFYLRFRYQKGGDWVKVTTCQLEAVPAGKKPSSPRPRPSVSLSVVLRMSARSQDFFPQPGLGSRQD